MQPHDGSFSCWCLGHNKGWFSRGSQGMVEPGETRGRDGTVATSWGRRGPLQPHGDPLGQGLPGCGAVARPSAAALGVVQEPNLEENQEPPSGNTPRAGRSRAGGAAGAVPAELKKG